MRETLAFVSLFFIHVILQDYEIGAVWNNLESISEIATTKNDTRINEFKYLHTHSQTHFFSYFNRVWGSSKRNNSKLLCRNSLSLDENRKKEKAIANNKTKIKNKNNSYIKFQDICVYVSI